MAKIKQAAQIDMKDRFIEDPELAEEIEKFMETRAAAQTHGTAKKAINARLILLGDVANGTRIRCNSRGPGGQASGYVITMKERAGGGFEVKPWRRTFAGKIEDAD